MSLSGVLLNHPHMISRLSVPRWLVPGQYHPVNWSRGGIVNAVFPGDKPGVGYFGGRFGVYKSIDGVVQDNRIDDGYPPSPFYRKTNHLHLLETEQESYVLAATDGGLFLCTSSDEKWRQIDLGENHEPVRKILAIDELLLVFTTSGVYASPANVDSLRFSLVNVPPPPHTGKVSLVRLFFDLHNGEIWGLQGKLLFDAAGLILLFLSISAFYEWFYKKLVRTKRKKKVYKPSGKHKGMFLFMHKYHLKLGIWAAVILLIMGGTGLFMRPPLIALILGDVPRGFYPGPMHKNPWHDKIKNALYDHIEDEIVIETEDEFLKGSVDFKQPFEKFDLSVPVFVMGTTVFDVYGDGGFIVGSFSGIFHREREGSRVVDMVTNLDAAEMSTVRPGDIMARGYFKTPVGAEYITAHQQGLMPLGESTSSEFQMPQSVFRDYHMPLWNYLFEIHNGRFFKDWIGGFYILLVPLGSLLFIIITLTGVYDWIMIKVRR